jgi:predicted DNA-binding antitoxin AbrB/MazE fold protein
MIVNTLAVYENGLLRPAQPLPLTEGETVPISVLCSSPVNSPSTEKFEAQVRAARTLAELFALADAHPDNEDGYDLRRALNANRKGERPLFPPELEGVSW